MDLRRLITFLASATPVAAASLLGLTTTDQALTDDDSGNKLVRLPVVHISGGVNDGRIPGLPVC